MHICMQIFDFGIGEHEKREEEVKSFWECVEEAKQDNKRLGMLHIDDFTEMKKRVSGTHSEHINRVLLALTSMMITKALPMNIPFRDYLKFLVSRCCKRCLR